MNEPQTTDELVLADPGDFTVPEVLDALSRATPEQIEAVKALEADGKNRAGIRDFETPEPETAEAPAEPEADDRTDPALDHDAEPGDPPQPAADEEGANETAGTVSGATVSSEALSPEEIAAANEAKVAQQPTPPAEDTADLQPTEPADDSEPEFSRERVLSYDEGPVIAGHPYPVIVGALSGDDSATFTRPQIAQKVEKFLGRELTEKE